MDLKRKFSDLCLDTQNEESFLKKLIIEDFNAFSLNDSTPSDHKKVAKDINLKAKTILNDKSISSDSSTTFESTDEFNMDMHKYENCILIYY